MFLLNHSCDISRNVEVGVNGNRAVQALYSAVPCLAIPMPAPATIQNGWEIGRGYDFYFNDGQDVKVGDKLGFNSNTYVVSAVERFTQLAPVSHIHVLAQQEVS